jgi:hypothetical protein
MWLWSFRLYQLCFKCVWHILREIVGSSKLS